MATPGGFGFDIPADDRSVFYLSQIFGKVGDVLGGAAPSFIGTLFLTINTVALTVGAIIVVYVTVVGMMKTAAEGEFLGKHWNSLWVPIRMVAGVASLFPASSGYSVLQVIIMWIILQGIGAADKLWSAAITYPAIARAVSAANSATSNAMIGINPTIQGLFQGFVCEATSNMGDIPGVPPDQITFGSNKGTGSTSLDGPKYMMGTNGSCGTLEKCDNTTCNSADTAACALCKAQTDALNTIVPDLKRIAQSFVNADKEYIVFYYTANRDPTNPLSPGKKAEGWITGYCDKNSLKIADERATCCVPPAVQDPLYPFCLKDPPRQFPTPYTTSPSKTSNMSTGDDSELDWIQRWVLFPTLTGKSAPVELKDISDFSKLDFVKIYADYYIKSLTDAASNIDPSKIPPPPKEKGSDYDPDKAKNYGWITAGAYFYQIVMVANKSLTNTTLPFKITGSEAIVGNTSIRNNYKAAGEFLTKIIATPSSSEPGGGTGSTALPGEGGSNYGAALSETTNTLSSSWMNMLRFSPTKEDHSSSLLRIASFGQTLLIIAQLFYAVLILIAALAAVVAAIPGIVILGSGNMLSFLEAFKAVNAYFLPAVFILLGALMSMGALLGMYVPMIPFIVFTASVIGWFIAVVEAMVAAPIIALGLLSPGGQSEVFGRAEHSIMIIFNLFLRPTLMVFGLLVAAFVAEQVLSFICLGFRFAMYDVMHLQLLGLVEEVIFIAIFTSIVVTSMNQVFTLIHHIPERILTYIGGQAYSYGEAQAAQAVKGSVEAAAGQLAAAGKGTAQAAVKQMGKADEAKGGDKGMKVGPPQ